MESVDQLERKQRFYVSLKLMDSVEDRNWGRRFSGSRDRTC